MCVLGRWFSDCSGNIPGTRLLACKHGWWLIVSRDKRVPNFGMIPPLWWYRTVALATLPVTCCWCSWELIYVLCAGASRPEELPAHRDHPWRTFCASDWTAWARRVLLACHKRSGTALSHRAWGVSVSVYLCMFTCSWVMVHWGVVIQSEVFTDMCDIYVNMGIVTWWNSCFSGMLWYAVAEMELECVHLPMLCQLKDWA